MNTGIEHSSGDIIAFIDDDVLAPADWLDMVARCFERNDVHASAGLILPQSLDADSEILFERHVSFSRGFKRLEFGPGFFYDDSWHAVPVWNVGAGANLIIRRSILEETGPLCELLGPGTPTYSAEDAYLIYKVAKSGHTIVYDPDICVTHNHRNSKFKLVSKG